MTDFKGKVVIFTAPSGAGKTTVVSHLLETYVQISFSVSATTRSRRAGETHGQHYYFLTPEAFREKIDSGHFLEWEEVYKDRFYGTFKSEVDRIWSQNKHIIFDVDVKGASSLKENFGDSALAIFIKPPSLSTLVKRLKNRGTETPEELKKRIGKIKNELTYEHRFDKVIVNDVLEVTLKEAELMVEDFLDLVESS